MKITTGVDYDNLSNDDLNKVTYLYLGMALVVNLDKFYKMEKIETVYLREHNILDDVMTLTNLVDICFVTCNISLKVLNNLNLFNLSHLCLINCNLTEVPESIYNLTNLVDLTLNDNKIKSISSNIRNLKKLKGLYLSDNNLLTSLPIEINELVNLLELYLPINCKDFNIGGLIKLEIFEIQRSYGYIDYNSIINYNDAIKHCKNFIYEDKMVILNNLFEIPEHIKYVNFINQIENINNLPLNVEYVKILNYNYCYNFPYNLNELYITKNFYTNIKVPFNCKVFVKNKLIIC